MLDRYLALIYENKEEMSKARNRILDNFVEYVCNSRKLSSSEIRKAVSDEDSDLSAMYWLDVADYESELLFTKVMKSLGTELWQGNAWRNKTCRKNCPLGRYCRKQRVAVDNDCYCYGQILLLDLSTEYFEGISNTHDVRFIDGEEKEIVNISEKAATNSPDIQNFQFFAIEDLRFLFGEERERIVEKYIQKLGKEV